MVITRTLVLASSNLGKVKEIQAGLEGLPLRVQAQSDFNVASCEETGLCFVENAILKGRNASKVTGLPAIADDSGLVVDALEGKPGVHSARYGGPDATDDQNNEKLLEALKGVPEEERSARFHCTMVYLRHWEDPVPIICQGTWEGVILTAPRGDHGFGYDPLFYVPTHECASAQLHLDVKNQISHRGIALGCLLRHLRGESPPLPEVE